MRKNILIISLLLSGLANVTAADYYVRDGGTGNGSDWGNAADQIPTTMVRGTTYWIADGIYSARSIKIPPSGTSRIIIKKASPTEHGTNTGWNDSYGDGEAYFAGTWSSTSGSGGYITWDGSYEWGFRFEVPYSPGGGAAATFHVRADGGTFNGLEFKYCKAFGAGHEIWRYNWLAKSHVIWIQNNQGQQNSWRISHCWFSGCVTPIIIADADDWIIEHTKLSWATSSNPSFHSNVIWSDNADRWIFRYNYLYMWDVEGLLLAYGGNDHQIYGNLAVTTSGKFLQAYQGNSYSGWKVYNNTIVGATTGFEFDGSVSNFDIRNNLLYNCRGAASNWGAASHSYNYYSLTPFPSEANGVNGAGANPFVNSAAGDYRISSTISANMPRNKGAALGAPYTADYAGNQRGSDGAYDIGAYEYGGADPVDRPLTPNNFRVVQTAQ